MTIDDVTQKKVLLCSRWLCFENFKLAFRPIPRSLQGIQKYTNWRCWPLMKK